MSSALVRCSSTCLLLLSSAAAPALDPIHSSALGLSRLQQTPVTAAPTAPAGAVLREDIAAPGLVGHIFRPANAGPHPGVLLVGGSGGGTGWQDEMANLLAQRGFVALALGYFGLPGLPEELERIPLEYFDHALTYLRLQPDVDPSRLAIGGVSKGAEAALLIASRRPEIRGVAAFAPSGIVFQSIATGYPVTSSWSAGGREVPFVRYGTAAPGSPLPVGFYLAGLSEADPATIQAATIPVENINGPILLLTGRADTLWPSSVLAERVVARLRAHSFANQVEHIAYEDAGHLISSIRTDDVTRRGGTAAGNTQAQLDGQRRFLEFFDRALKQPLPVRVRKEVAKCHGAALAT